MIMTRTFSALVCVATVLGVRGLAHASGDGELTITAFRHELAPQTVLTENERQQLEAVDVSGTAGTDGQRIAYLAADRATRVVAPMAFELAAAKTQMPTLRRIADSYRDTLRALPEVEDQKSASAAATLIKQAAHEISEGTLDDLANASDLDRELLAQLMAVCDTAGQAADAAASGSASEVSSAAAFAANALASSAELAQVAHDERTRAEIVGSGIDLLGVMVKTARRLP
jgi:hypothetical protein